MLHCREAKKLCKKLKISPDTYILRHYKGGDFNKDYDRKENVNSIVNFMHDPVGDIPWEEDSTPNSIIHLSDEIVSYIKEHIPADGSI